MQLQKPFPEKDGGWRKRRAVQILLGPRALHRTGGAIKDALQVLAVGVALLVPPREAELMLRKGDQVSAELAIKDASSPSASTIWLPAQDRLGSVSSSSALSVE